MVVMTDGEENSSEKATNEGVKARIDERQAAGWAVVYLGANVDEFAEAGAIGIADYTTRGWDATEDGTDVVMADLSMATSRFLSGSVARERFWEPDENEGSQS